MEDFFGNYHVGWGLCWAGARVKVHSCEDPSNKSHLAPDGEAKLILQIKMLQPQAGFYLLH